MIAEFPNVDPIIVWSYLCQKKKIEPRVFIPSVLQFIWRGLAIAFKSFNSRKLIIVLIVLIIDQKQPLKKVFCKNKKDVGVLLKRCSRKFHKTHRKIPLPQSLFGDSEAAAAALFKRRP